MHRALTSDLFSWRVILTLLVCGLLFGSQQTFAEESPRLAHGLVNRQIDTLKKNQPGFGWKGGWVLSQRQPALFVDAKHKTSNEKHNAIAHEALIQGSVQRNNPLRRELKQTYQDQELFLRFRFRYAADAKQRDEGEFFVFWLDRYEGTDNAVHANHTPNIGVHVASSGPNKGKVVFMVRIGSQKTAWSSVELQRDRDYLIVGRLSKPEKSLRAGFTKFELWVDPKPGDLERPVATTVNPQSVNGVSWVGFATGYKTELDDRIYVSDLVLSRTWSDVLDLSPEQIPKMATKQQTAWAEPVHFEKEIYPLLKAKCFSCHAGANPDSGYRLDVYEELLGFSTGEELIVPGNSEQSKLVELVSTQVAEERMPPVDAGTALMEQEIAKLRAWIDQGAKWDYKLLPTPKTESDHWAFQTIKRPGVPKVDGSKPVRTPVDAFIARAWQKAGIKPAPAADKATLIRRLSLDLTGLPPSADEIEAFVHNTDPRAYEKLVERLLASKHYGERWARFWLDLTRWAESHGYQHDLPRPYAWRYRDYVIESFNADKPFDQFIREQLAGDELKPYADEHVIATGFLASARISGNQMDKAAQRNDVLVDIVNVTSGALLGLTLECAQCHNHKFDPLTQRDYYRLQGFFVNGQLGNLSLKGDGLPNPTEMKTWMPKGTFDFYQREAKKLINRKRFAHTKQPHTWGYYSPLTGQKQIERLPVVNRDPIPYSAERLKQTKSVILIRGDVHKQGPEVGKGWPAVLGATTVDSEKLSRTALADWLTGRKNPLVSRVWVNRLWQYHFGRGLVSTPSDFGVQGEPPSHPELLDWLATELMERGWSTKHIHRQIVLSSTYRQARSFNEANLKQDPENRLLWSWPRRRLEAEAIRDSILCATGELKRELGGPSVPQEREEANLRRTIYLFQRRSEMPSVMAMFDAPDSIASCSRRQVSTVALQPLFMLNSQFMDRRAQVLAKNIVAETDDDHGQQVVQAFVRVLGRQPTAQEQKRSLTFFQSDSSAESDERRLSMLCHALLNLNEFIYIP
ncbi:PSD1 and planctomycete cytochrome C domain-containing protein [Gimesia fumaroli]|uniref:Planctomycete cytochrome C n=1 Tax=Gimesia fumaroli TaxID=2527976 RepID=A0A518I9A8_9PLAN|nr:PSD1 and planctomycete cytochrome C domain-containing protein [Gimesia fumaroli]QDV49701.1 Planctomycete cytochrome C [Gimesia fumaroli]